MFELNNRVLDRFDFQVNNIDLVFMFVQVYSLLIFILYLINILFIGGDQDCYHSFEVDYLQVLPTLFELHVGNFYLQLASEPDRDRVLSCIREIYATMASSFCWSY